MANDFYTETPGSAVAAQLQNILTQKRLQARQDLLDQVAMQEFQQNWALKKQQMDSLADERRQHGLEFEARMRLHDAQTARDWLQNQSERGGPIDEATYLKGSAIDPTRYQKTPDAVPPQFLAPPPPDATPAEAPPAMYRDLGSDKYRRRQETQQGLNTLFSDPNFDKLTPSQQLQKIAPLFPDTDPAKTLEALLASRSQQPAGRLIGVDEANKNPIDLGTGNPFTGTLTPNDHVVMIPRPAREPREPQTPTPTVTHIGDTPDKNPIFATNRLDAKGNPLMMTVVNGVWQPYLGRVVKPNVERPVPLHNQVAFDKYSAALKNNIPGSEGLRNAWVGSIQEPYRSEVQAVIDRDKAEEALHHRLNASEDVVNAPGYSLPDAVAPENEDVFKQELIRLLRMARKGH